MGHPSPRVEAEEMQLVTTEEIQHLADSIDPHCHTLILLVVYTSLRWAKPSACASINWRRRV